MANAAQYASASSENSGTIVAPARCQRQYAYHGNQSRIVAITHSRVEIVLALNHHKSPDTQIGGTHDLSPAVGGDR